jgi:hypothetical protein
MTAPQISDEVQKLADALFDKFDGDCGDIRADLRTLAGDAAAVGARTALEDARDWWFDTGHDDVVEDLTDRISTYTTDEETAHGQ